MRRISENSREFSQGRIFPQVIFPAANFPSGPAANFTAPNFSTANFPSGKISGSELSHGEFSRGEFSQRRIFLAYVASTPQFDSSIYLPVVNLFDGSMRGVGVVGGA